MNHDLYAAFEEFLEVRAEYLIEPMREDEILPHYPDNHVLQNHREEYPEDPIHASLYNLDIWGPPEIEEPIRTVWTDDCLVMDPPPVWCGFGPLGEERETKIERIAEILDNYLNELEDRELILFQELLVMLPNDPMPV